jgi:hypothetical protein
MNSSVSSIVLRLKDSQSPTMMASVSCGTLHLHVMQKWASAEYWLIIAHWQSIFKHSSKRKWFLSRIGTRSTTLMSGIGRSGIGHVTCWKTLALVHISCSMLNGCTNLTDKTLYASLTSHGQLMPFGIVKYVCATKFECSNNVNACCIVVLAEGWRKALCFHFICW